MFLLPYAISLLISFSVGLYAWRRRTVTGARAYAVIAFSQAAWTAGYICELLSPDLSGKLFWDNFQWIGSAGWGAGLLLFAHDYTQARWPHERLVLSFLIFPLFILAPLSYTDAWHHLVHANIALIPAEPSSALTYQFTPLDWLVSLYGYLLTLGSLGVLLVKYFRAHALYRTQIGLVIVGNAIPLAGTFFTLSGVAAGPYRDFTPFTFAVGNLIVAWSLFRYHLFDIVPVARGALIESMSDAVYVLDAANRLVDLNPAARQALGVDITDVIGQPADRVFGRWPDIVTQYQQVDQVQSEIGVTTDRGSVYLELKIQSLRDQHGQLTGRLILARDVTDRRRTQEELQARTTQLEHANERLQILSQAKDEFVSNVSHELRTPISNLKLHLDLLAKRPERWDEVLYTLRRETNRLGDMIESLLLLSRLDQNQIDTTFAAFDVNALIEEYVNDRRRLASDRGLTLSCEAVNESTTVMGERNLIGQVLSILLTNAINYTPADGHIIVTTRQRPDECLAGFSVSDTGPGISLQERSRLFSRFFRGTAGRSSNIAGTGLGLALVKEIVDRHQGHIEVYSTGIVDQGAIFTIWLPTAEASNSHPAEDLTSQVTSPVRQ
jgi:PAS domain S-box-containing protein